jgi:hypothetical protein
MKQLLSLFLILLPCLAWAQYPSNGNQKITLGEQTTADGLIWRGVLADTGIITPSSDTSAYIILDTVNHRFYNYNRATNVWSVAGGGTAVTTFSAGSTGLTPNTATSGSVTLGGTLAVANGGTNTTTLTANKVMVGNGSGVLTPTNLHWDNTNSRLAVGQTSTLSGATLSVRGGLHIIDPDTTNGTDNLMYIYPKEQTTSGPNNSEFAMFMAGPNSTSSDDGPIFLLRGNNYTRIANQKGLLLFTSGTNVAASGNNGKILFISQHGLNFTGVSTFTSLAGTGSRTVVADLNGVLSAPVSSINTKENVQTLNYGLNELLQINPVSFDYINKEKWGDERNLGFIVEDMFPVIPEVTGTMNNGDMYLDMTKLIPVLTKAIQEQQALIKALEQRIINLENK